MQTYISHMHNIPEHNLGNPTLLYAARLDNSELDHPRSTHSHADIVEFVYILRGSGEYEIAGHRYPVESGNLVIYNNGVMHNECPVDQRIPILCCAAAGIQIPGLSPNCVLNESTSPVLYLGEKKHIFRHLMQAIFDESLAGDSRSAEICQALFLALLHMTLSHIETHHASEHAEKRPDHISNKIRAYVDAHAAADITVPQVAAEFQISESYLARVFKQSFGCTLTTYLIRRRIGEAQTLLLTTDLSISEIAQRVGYENQSYFSKIFMQNVDISPLRYRKLYRSISNHFIGK